MESSSSASSLTVTDKMDLDVKDNEVFRKVIFEPIRIGPVSTLDEMDCKVLQFQNKKLDMKLEEYQRIENELQQRIEQLEKRQSQDTIVMNVVNRYWNHLNEDVKTMLLEFDDECQNVADEIENEAASAFIKTLAACNESQIDDKLISNVEMSTSALTRIMQTYDHIIFKFDETVTALKSVPNNSTDSNETKPTELERLVCKKEDCNDRNNFKRRNKHPNRTNSIKEGPNQSLIDVIDNKEAQNTLPNSTDLLQNSNIVTETNCSSHGTTTNEKPNNEVTFTKNSITKQNSAKCVENAQLSSTKTIDFITIVTAEPGSIRSPNNVMAESNGGDDDAKNCPEIDDSIRVVVADIVERVASKFEFGDSNSTFDESDLLDADNGAKMEDDVFEDNYKISDGEALLNGEDETKFHVKLSAVKMTNDRMKEKSKICFAVLKELKNVCVDTGDENERLQSIISAFQEEHQKSLSNEQCITEALKFKEHEYEQWKSRVDDIEYENEKLKRRKSKIECHMTEARETLEKIKLRKRCRERNDCSSNAGKK